MASDIKQLFQHFNKQHTQTQDPNQKQRAAQMRADASKQVKMGVCDPVYRKLIGNMLDEHSKDPMPSALIFVNSFDFEKEDIEEYMEDHKIYAEVFEIDRMRSEERLEYLNCLNAEYGTKQLPIIFIKDKFIGDFKSLQAFHVPQ